MEHVAIMKKSWGLLPKIFSGEKKIESRWYLNKSIPRGKIAAGETVYFKNSGEPVTVKAQVEKVLSFDNLIPQKVEELVWKYGGKDGIGSRDLNKFYKMFKDKRYCLLIFLKNPQKIIPFNINKKGFGSMAAWICVDRVEKIKI